MTETPEPRSEAWTATAEPIAVDDTGTVHVEHDDESTLDDRTRAKLQKARNEAKNLRSRLHEAEERATASDEKYGEAAAIVSAMQFAEIKRVAGEVLHDPDDLLTHQPDVSNYFDDEFAGIISADKVSEQAKQLIRQRPHLGKPPVVAPPPPTDRPIEGLKSGAMPEEKPAPANWSAVIRGL